MNLMSDFWDMGGYAVYVWPAYAVSLAALIILGWMSFRKMKTLKTRLDALKEDKKK